ncbi:MAG: cyclic nucleotide-binding domain-containing protein [Chloroflexi bacterium]|nr:cyclic nucleotide-binding domain-containing protein [Chloroflexota bacterium]
MVRPRGDVGVYSGSRVVRESLDIVERTLVEKPLEVTFTALKCHPLFDGWNNTSLMQMFPNGSNIVRFQPGEYLCLSGYPVDNIMFLLYGRAKAELRARGSLQQTIVLDLLGPGSIIGLMSLVDCGPHSATVVAMTGVGVVCLDTKQMRLLLQNNPRWYKICAEIAAERLRNSGTWLEALLS